MKATSSTSFRLASAHPQHPPAFHTNRPGPNPVGVPSGYTTMKPFASARPSKSVFCSNWVPEPKPPWSATRRGTARLGKERGT